MNQYFDNHIHPFNFSNFLLLKNTFIQLSLLKIVLFNCHKESLTVVGREVDNFSLLIIHLYFCLG